MKNLRKAIEFCDRTKIYDNTHKKHELLFELEGKSIKSIENVKFPQWLHLVMNIASLKLGGGIEFIG